MRFDVIFTDFKLIHPQKESSSIEVTPGGIVMDVNDEHPKNTPGPIDVTEDGILIEVRL